MCCGNLFGWICRHPGNNAGVQIIVFIFGYEQVLVCYCRQLSTHSERYRN